MTFFFFLIMPLQLVATGRTSCAVKSKEKLICEFPHDISKTQTDFCVYFYPENGGEDPLVDCIWTNEQLHCITQKGFECQQPVSDIAVISVPNNFTDKRGNYRCVPFGYNHTMARPCRYPVGEGSPACTDVARLPVVVSLALLSMVI